MKEENSLVTYFGDRLEKLRVHEDTRSYILGVFNDMGRGIGDLSDESMVLRYYDAVLTGDFKKFQMIGDYVLWATAMVPQSIKEHQLVMSLGQKSYQTCWRLMRGQWTLYNELGERLPEISAEIKVLLVF